MFVNGDFAFGKAAAELRRLDLKNKVVPAHGIIASHGSLFFDREDKLEASAAIRDEGRVLLSRWLDQRFAVPGQEGFEDVAISIRDGFDAVKF